MCVRTRSALGLFARTHAHIMQDLASRGHDRIEQPSSNDAGFNSSSKVPASEFRNCNFGELF